MKELEKKLTRREQESAKKQVLIYQTAVSLFKEYGYDKITVDDIAEATGMSKGSIYNFFPKKIDLLYAFFNDLYEHDVMDLENSRENLADPAVSILKYCNEISHAYEELGYELSVQIQNVYSEYMRLNDQRESGVTVKLTAFITEAQKAGTFDLATDPHVAAQCIEIVASGVFRKWIISGGAYSLVGANNCFLPFIINMFVPEKYQMESAPPPSQSRRLS